MQVMLKPSSDEPLYGGSEGFLDLSELDFRLPLLVYVSREKRPGYDHNKKAGAMNALVRASAIMYVLHDGPRRRPALLRSVPAAVRRTGCLFRRIENRALRIRPASVQRTFLWLLAAAASLKFGNSTFLIESIPVAEFQGRPLADRPSIKNGRQPGALTIPRELLHATTVAEAIVVISCWYEDKTEWGRVSGGLTGRSRKTL
ncbi:unnamed protein product [Microthlaspi erraticum]|uniref:Uncharacterized protein n=1 Tax=Microthlaspi erraticum TaxID=1685480 RepID=A0A6D2LQ46_9BRAS|nr:unnamed protein product [Microthlaspi erraticum]